MLYRKSILYYTYISRPQLFEREFFVHSLTIVCSFSRDYATKVFGFATFGRIYGTVICVSGLGQFIQPALDALTHGPLHENPIPLNIAFAVSGTTVAAALTLFVYVKTRANSNESGTEEERRGLLRDGGRRGGNRRRSYVDG